jgi:hypothetical protein
MILDTVSLLKLLLNIGTLFDDEIMKMFGILNVVEPPIISKPKTRKVLAPVVNNF